MRTESDEQLTSPRVLSPAVVAGAAITRSVREWRCFAIASPILIAVAWQSTHPLFSLVCSL